jgi:hypothetical protein
LGMRRDFIVEIVLERAIRAARIPLIEDGLDLVGDALLTFIMLA